MLVTLPLQALILGAEIIITSPMSGRTKLGVLAASSFGFFGIHGTVEDIYEIAVLIFEFRGDKKLLFGIVLSLLTFHSRRGVCWEYVPRNFFQVILSMI